MARRSAIRVRLRRWLRGVLRARGGPEAIALGFAIGAFFAFNPPPPFGLQMVLAAVVATLLGGSRVPALAATWITNVVTTPFLAPFCYEVGIFTLRFLGFPAENHWHRILAIVEGAESLSCAGVRQVGMQLLGLGWSILGPYVLGSFLVGLAVAAVSYPIVLRLVKGHILLRSQKRARRWQKQLERSQAAEKGMSTFCAERPEGPADKRNLSPFPPPVAPKDDSSKAPETPPHDGV